ncbi:hypothetical protein RKD37_008481 [Streptomyces ambofaciens]
MRNRATGGGLGVQGQHVRKHRADRPAVLRVQQPQPVGTGGDEQRAPVKAAGVAPVVGYADGDAERQQAGHLHDVEAARLLGHQLDLRRDHRVVGGAGGEPGECVGEAGHRREPARRRARRPGADVRAAEQLEVAAVQCGGALGEHLEAEFETGRRRGGGIVPGDFGETPHDVVGQHQVAAGQDGLLQQFADHRASGTVRLVTGATARVHRFRAVLGRQAESAVRVDQFAQRYGAGGAVALDEALAVVPHVRQRRPLRGDRPDRGCVPAHFPPDRLRNDELAGYVQVHVQGWPGVRPAVRAGDVEAADLVQDLLPGFAAQPRRVVLVPCIRRPDVPQRLRVAGKRRVQDRLDAVEQRAVDAVRGDRAEQEAVLQESGQLTVEPLGVQRRKALPQ